MIFAVVVSLMYACRVFSLSPKGDIYKVIAALVTIPLGLCLGYVLTLVICEAFLLFDNSIIVAGIRGALTVGGGTGLYHVALFGFKAAPENKEDE